MGEILTAIFGNNSILATICVALLPLLELKGAIPFGISADLWGSAALSTWQAFGWALLGSSLVVPIIALLFTPIYNWLKTKKFFKTILDFIVGDVAQRSDKMNAENQGKTSARTLWLKIVAIFLFVAFPVPGTGVWTGTCFAVLLGLNFWVICATVIAGNAVCGVIVTFVCEIFPGFENILLLIFIAVIVLYIVYRIIAHCIKKRRAVTTTPAEPAHENPTPEAK
ncbi:MAG: small multi-drug export protein [Clostridia bacterium]|nr:small multi-drug export protein [Clostridia bacterium]